MASVYTHNKEFTLAGGRKIQQLQLAYTLLGTQTASSRIVWVFHALSGTSDPQQWWDGLIGEGKTFDPKDYTIICANLPGSCYGSSGPLSINPETNQPYFHSFPVFSTTDTINAFRLLQQHLGIQKIHIGIGASMGGQHLLQWALEDPLLFENIIPVACNALQSAWSLAIDAAQRLAIEADGTWKEAQPKAGINGMKAARALALVHYRTYQSFAEKEIGRSVEKDAESYQRYQGAKLAERFNAFSYYNLSLSRKTYNLGKGYHSAAEALQNIQAKTLVIGIDSDGLFPVHEQEFLATHIPGATFKTITSIYGHDAFLVEYGQLEKSIKSFLNPA